MLSFEIAGKEQVQQLVNNPILKALLQDKVYHVNSTVSIEMFGDFNFTLSMPSDRLILTCNDVRPRVTIKKFITIHGRLTSLSIGQNDIIVAVEGLPDVVLKLV